MLKQYCNQDKNLPNNTINNEKIIREFIKHIEININKLDIITKNSIRNDLIQILNKIKYNNQVNDTENITLKEGIEAVKQFMSEYLDTLHVQIKIIQLY